MIRVTALAIALSLSPACVAADPVPQVVRTPSENGYHQDTRLILLGTGGGPIIRVGRSQPANLLIVGGRPYLIDAGSGTVLRLKQAGFDIGQVSDLFLTHLHFDHTGDLPSLLLLNWLSGGQHVINIWGPHGTRDMLSSAVDYLKTNENLYAAILPLQPPMAQVTTAHDVSADARRVLIFQDDLVRVYAVENSHYSAIPEAKRHGGAWKSYSYRFETPDKIIVFTGDTGPSHAVAELAKGADILVSEVVNVEAMTRYLKRANPALSEKQLEPLLEHTLKQHLSPVAVGRLAEEAGVKRVVLSHVSPGFDGETDPSAYIDGVKAHYSGPVALGTDLDEF